jgi:outer membrane receptor protein involved in Fe transport
MEKNLRLKLVTTAILAAFAHLPMAYADEMPAADTPVVDAAPVAVETAPAEAAVDNAPLNLDKIVVTGSAKKISKMKSSVSISTLNAEQVQNTGATNAAEVLRSIPGIRSEASGGEGNANITVRGLPISAGGARYLQLQEDGLPILQFGDIAFATPDMFYRADFGLNSLEVVRGGSGSTLATNSPGGLINFINNTGEVKGGKVGVTAGLNFNEYRTDFAYGGPIDDNGLRGFVSGFYRRGDGLRDANETLEKGGQIKANLTKQLDNGYVRVSLKHLDDQTPVNLPVPITTNANGRISRISGIDPRDVTFYGKNWPKDITTKGSNKRTSSDVNDGMTVETDSIGVEASFDFGDGWNISDKFRWADNRGRFIGIFPYNSDPFTSIGNQIATNGTFTGAVFNTSLNDMGNTVNDLKISKAFTFSEKAKLTPTLGLYTSVQDVDLTWSFNSYTIEASNNPASVVFLTPSSGAGGASTFGGCCSRDIDAKYRTISPYLSLALEVADLNIDASIRRDKQDATGSYAQANSATGLYGARNRIDYDKSFTSYSLGANYRLNTNLAFFGRVSRGAAFNADRIMFGSANLDGGTIPINEVKQYEAGVKFRQGNFNTFVTLFKADTDESNFEATTQKSTSNTYDAKGIEVEMGYSMDHFRIGGGLTYTDAEIDKSPGNPGLVGKDPNRQAKLVYQITPSFVWNQFTLGSSIIGTTSSVDSRDGKSGKGVKMPGFTVVNAFLRYEHNKNWQGTLSANNLFDEIGYTEAQGGVDAL